MPNPTAAMLVIGDEILSGRTRDTNTAHLARELTQHGIDLAEVRVVRDEHGDIVAAVTALSAKYDHLFTSGGIGPTHDDITADAVAAAMGATIDIRADARALLAAHYASTGSELNAARLRMARIPAGAGLIDNPVSVAPGFTIGNVHVMAGVPAVFTAMVASVLSGLTGGAPLLSQTLRVERGEGDVAAPLAALAALYPDLSFGSYPYQRDGVFGTNLVVRGDDAARLDAAMVALARDVLPKEQKAMTARQQQDSAETDPGRKGDPDYFAALDATWPAAAFETLGDWTLRRADGGGKRVGAATTENETADIAAAETAMRAGGQVPLFMVRDNQDRLDTALAQRRYARIDPVRILACPVETLTTAPVPRVTAFCLWEPLEIMREIWAQGGIGPERIAIMHRAQEPKTGILSRRRDKPAGTAFAAMHGPVAMVHAVEVLPAQRRQGAAAWMMRAAAFWAQAQGAREVAVLVTEANSAARALYASLGMREVGRYHYRQSP